MDLDRPFGTDPAAISTEDAAAAIADGLSPLDAQRMLPASFGAGAAADAPIVDMEPARLACKLLFICI